MNTLARAMDAMLGSAADRQRDTLVRDLKAKGYKVAQFHPDLRNLDARTAHAVAALAREGVAVADPGGQPLGAWKAV